MIEISLKFVPKCPFNNISSLVQIMAWCWPGDKPLSEPTMVSVLMHICVTRPQWVNLKFVRLIHYWARDSPGPRFNIKMSSYRYRKSHCGDKTVVRSSYLHNGISHTSKMSSLYWIGAQASYFTFLNESVVLQNSSPLWNVCKWNVHVYGIYKMSEN